MFQLTPLGNDLRYCFLSCFFYRTSLKFSQVRVMYLRNAMPAYSFRPSHVSLQSQVLVVFLHGCPAFATQTNTALVFLYGNSIL